MTALPKYCQILASSIAPPQFQSLVQESDFFLLFSHLLSPSGSFPQFGLSLGQQCLRVAEVVVDL